jgi:hypothetical protein
MKTESPPDASAGVSGASNPRPATPESSNPSAPQTAADAFHDATARLVEIREYVSFYLAAKADALKLSVRSAVFYAVLGVVGLIAASAAVVVAVTLLLIGIAHGLGALFGGHLWLGDLIVGIVILGVIALGAKMAVSKVFGSSRTKTVEKYESRKRVQRNRFGHDLNRQPQRQAR